MQMCKPNLTKSTFDRLCDILNTLKSIAQNPPRTTSKTLEMGQVNPHEPTGKLITVWYRNGHSDDLLRMIMREHMTFLVQRHFKKPTPETNQAHQEYLMQLFDPNMIGFLENEPLDEIHPLESSQITENTLELYLMNPHAKIFQEDQQTAEICQGISDLILKQLN